MSNALLATALVVLYITGAIGVLLATVGSSKRSARWSIIILLIDIVLAVIIIRAYFF